MYTIMKISILFFSLIVCAIVSSVFFREHKKRIAFFTFLSLIGVFAYLVACISRIVFFEVKNVIVDAAKETFEKVILEDDTIKEKTTIETISSDFMVTRPFSIVKIDNDSLFQEVYKKLLPSNIEIVDGYKLNDRNGWMCSIFELKALKEDIFEMVNPIESKYSGYNSDYVHRSDMFPASFKSYQDYIADCFPDELGDWGPRDIDLYTIYECIKYPNIYLLAVNSKTGRAFQIYRWLIKGEYYIRTSEHVAFLQSLLDKKAVAHVSWRFYKSICGDEYLFPIKFPYYLYEFDGYSEMELRSHYRDVPGINANLSADGINALNFDKNVLILKQNYGRKYSIAQWSDSTFQTCSTAKEAWSYASLMGYKGEFHFFETIDIDEKVR